MNFPEKSSHVLLAFVPSRFRCGSYSGWIRDEWGEGWNADAGRMRKERVNFSVFKVHICMITKYNRNNNSGHTFFFPVISIYMWTLKRSKEVWIIIIRLTSSLHWIYPFMIPNCLNIRYRARRQSSLSISLYWIWPSFLIILIVIPGRGHIIGSRRLFVLHFSPIDSTIVFDVPLQILYMEYPNTLYLSFKHF